MLQYLHVLNKVLLIQKNTTLYLKKIKNFFFILLYKSIYTKILFLIFKNLKDNIFYKNNIKLKTDFEILIISHITNLSHIEEKLIFILEIFVIEKHFNCFIESY